MLNINRSVSINKVSSYSDSEVNKQSSGFLNMKKFVFAASSVQDSSSVALRCDMPLDAIELDFHGYLRAFYENDNGVWEETFISLNKLGIDVIAYFSDVCGPNFNIDKLEQFASRFNIKLCQVVLPFCPSGMALWDDAQWRIFDARLAEAIGRVATGCSQNLKFNGGQRHATFH